MNWMLEGIHQCFCRPGTVDVILRYSEYVIVKVAANGKELQAG